MSPDQSPDNSPSQHSESSFPAWKEASAGAPGRESRHQEFRDERRRGALAEGRPNPPRLYLRSRRVELEAEEAEVRRRVAEAAVIEQQAALLEAEAAAKAGHAAKVSAREGAEISGYWVRIALTVLAFLLTAGLLVAGFAAGRIWAYPSAVLAGGCFYPLKPWEFLSSREQTSEEDP